MDISNGNADVRRRLLAESASQDGHTVDTVDGQVQGPQRNDNRTSRNFHLTNASLAFFVIGLFHFLIFAFIHHRLNTFPVPKTVVSSKQTDFIEENARKHLDLITGFGARVSGSEANRKSEEYIMNQIKQIKQQSLLTSNSVNIDYDLQVVSGGFTLDFINAGIGEFTSVYQDLRNIIVKVSPVRNVSTSILVNCHYDTVVDSPGAGDDAASCCVMLEILRALTHKKIALRHNLVFLFNSAEENILQTSHGFITQHPWAAAIKAFVNLDSAGAGGWEMVFQTGPEHPWLIKAYIESAPYPHASVIGQEIFQTGLIPSDTDFRIFRDYGKIPGIDIAHIKNGYVYHTKNDQARFIQPGCMQRGGENVMALLITLGQSSKVVDPGEDKHGTMVFYDFLGFFMVAYPSRMANILNWTTFVYVYVAFLKRLLRESFGDSFGAIKQMGLVIVCVFTTWLLCIIVPLGMGLFVTLLGLNMPYFTHNLNIVWLFILPAVLVNICFHYILKKSVFKHVPAHKMVIMVQDANLLLWSLVLAIMTSLGVMAAFLPLLCILWPALLYTFLNLFGLKPSNIVVNLIASFVPTVYVLSLVYALHMFLIPIMGRTGMDAQPDLLIAAVSAFPVIVCLPYHIGFVYTHHGVSRVIQTIFAVITLGLLAVFFTPAGFPYSSKATDASPQRAILVHFDRTFHSPTKEVIKKDANIWYMPLDKNGFKLLGQNAPEVLSLAQEATCDGVYCGRPYLYPVLKLVDPRKTLDFPASTLSVPHVDVTLVSQEEISPNEKKLIFSMSGPSHVTIFITELPGANVKKWSFGHNVPLEILTLPSIHEPTFFIYYSNAGLPNTTWEFDLFLEQSSQITPNSSLIKMGFAGHYLHGPHKVTKDLQNLEHKLPPWISPVTWSATYDEYFF